MMQLVAINVAEWDERPTWRWVLSDPDGTPLAQSVPTYQSPGDALTAGELLFINANRYGVNVNEP